MSTEKSIRLQSKKALSGNWVEIIAAMCALFALILGIIYITNSALIYFKIVSLDTGMPNKSSIGLFYIVNLLYIICVLLISPLLNGVVKTAANIAVNGTADMGDFLYFFKSFKKYIKTIGLNFIIFAEFLFFFSIFDISAYLTAFSKFKFDGDNIFSTGSLIFILCAAATAVIAVLLYLIFLHFPLSAYALNDKMPFSHYVFGYIGFGFKNLGKSLKMVVGFIGWILLCFFVLPAIYVLPYICVSMVNSARWLLKLDKRSVIC